MRMIEDIAMAKVWVIEKDSGSIIQEEDTPEKISQKHIESCHQMLKKL